MEYNRIPVEIRAANTAQTFKYKLKKWVMGNACCYTTCLYLFALFSIDKQVMTQPVCPVLLLSRL